MSNKTKLQLKIIDHSLRMMNFSKLHSIECFDVDKLYFGNTITKFKKKFKIIYLSNMITNYLWKTHRFRTKIKAINMISMRYENNNINHLLCISEQRIRKSPTQHIHNMFFNKRL